jgi:hypothetical protein
MVHIYVVPKGNQRNLDDIQDTNIKADFLDSNNIREFIQATEHQEI